MARREQIIDAAERVFLTRDPAEVSFEEIANAAGTSRGLVYHYFGDKHRLVAAVYMRGRERLDARLAAAIDGIADLDEECLRRIVRVYIGFAREIGPGFAHLHASRHFATREARRPRVEQLADRWFSGPTAVVLANGIVDLLEGIALGWLDEADAVDRDDVAASVAALLWCGLGRLQTS